MMKLNKIAVLVAVVALLVSGASAKIAVDWRDDRFQEGSIYLVDGVTLLPLGTTVQLIWSPVDSGLSGLDANDPLVPSGAEEVVLFTREVNNQFGEAGYFDAITTNATASVGSYVGGFVYQRIFATTFGDKPAIGSYYQEGDASLALSDQDVPNPPTATMSFLWDSRDTGDDFYVNMQIVPEPATIALAAAGIGLLIVRRFRKKK